MLIARIDRDGRHRFANDAYRAAFGCGVDDLVGRPFDAVVGELWGTMADHVVAALAGSRRDFETRVAGGDGTVGTLRVVFEPERDAAGTLDGFVVVLSEPRDSARAARARAEAEETLRRADQRRNELLATLAHELRNPLNPIRNALEVMRARPIDDRDVAWCRDVIDRQSRHLSRLVDDLFDVSRVSRGRLALRTQPVDLRRVLESAIEASLPLLKERGHRLEFEPPDESLPLDADEVRLVQAFGNVLENSAKYTEPGGSIGLRIVRDAAGVEVTIRDDGIGIPSDVLPYVFDLFMQAPSSIATGAGGLGIGLTLARQLIELHGGTITARSEGIGRGSEFRVRLPLAANVDVPDATATSPAASGSSSLRILIADDNVDGAESLAMLLEIRGYDVRITHDGRHALRIADAFRPHVAFLDLGMPELDGYEVCRTLRQSPRGAGIRLIALTGWGQAEDRARTHAAGFDHHVVKPLDVPTLERLLGC